MIEATRQKAAELRKQYKSRYAVRQRNAFMWMPQYETYRIQEGQSTNQTMKELQCIVDNHHENFEGGEEPVDITYKVRIWGTDEWYVEFITLRKVVE